MSGELFLRTSFYDYYNILYILFELLTCFDNIKTIYLLIHFDFHYIVEDSSFDGQMGPNLSLQGCRKRGAMAPHKIWKKGHIFWLIRY